jgi:hypothetical protein
LGSSDGPSSSSSSQLELVSRGRILTLQASTFARLSIGRDLMGGPGRLGNLALPSRKLQYDWMLGELLRPPARNDIVVDFRLLLQ